MMKLRAAVGILLLSSAMAAYAQKSGVVEHAAPSCITSGTMPLLSCATADQGALRAFFRKVGHTDWCSVDGNNRGLRSDVTLPRFEANERIEYYLVVLNDKQVLAKSPQIYQVSVMSRCDTPFARHATLPTMECLPPGANPLASSLAAGYAAASTPNPTTPPVGSPEKPERQ